MGFVPLAALGYGKARLYLFFAGMGVPAADPDIAQVDALTVGVQPLVWVALFLVLGWVVARSLDGHSRAMASLVFVILLLGAVGTFFSGLSDAEQRGRRVAAGLGSPSVPGLRLAPGPTPKCLMWASPETGIDAASLPREVWQIGREGGRLLVLDPEEARRAHPVPVPAGASSDSYVPRGTVVAPIRPLGVDQVRLLPKTRGDCGTAYRRSP